MDIQPHINYSAITQANDQFVISVRQLRFPDKKGKLLKGECIDILLDYHSRLMGKLQSQAIQGIKFKEVELLPLLVEAHKKLVATAPISDLPEGMQAHVALGYVGKVIQACMSACRMAGLPDPRIEPQHLAEALGIPPLVGAER